jgi:hypothetical protein
MARRVYYVSYEKCTDMEPHDGWWVGQQTAFDIEDNWPVGPYSTRIAALEARDEFEAMDEEDAEEE